MVLYVRGCADRRAIGTFPSVPSAEEAGVCVCVAWGVGGDVRDMKYQR